MKLFLVCLGLATLSAAMIPRQGQVMPDPADIGEEGSASRPEPTLRSPGFLNSTALLGNTTATGGNTNSTSEPKPICAYHTPCAWVVYKPPIKFIDYNFTNAYCVCAEGTYCISTEDDTLVSAYVLRCREVDPATLIGYNEQEESDS